MIVTVTLNPALDLTYDVAALVPHGTHRVATVHERPGGKGLNVARVLHRLGEPVLATGLLGGPTGARVAGLLTAEGVPSSFVEIAGETRRTVAVVDPGDATGFWEPGPAITPPEWAAFVSHFRSLLPRADVVTLSGSLPPGLPADAYADLIALARANNVPTILDASGPALAAGLRARPSIIKPNVTELTELLASPPDHPTVASIPDVTADDAAVAPIPDFLAYHPIVASIRDVTADHATAAPTRDVTADDATAASIRDLLADHATAAPIPDVTADHPTAAPIPDVTADHPTAASIGDLTADHATVASISDVTADHATAAPTRDVTADHATAAPTRDLTADHATLALIRGLAADAVVVSRGAHGLLTVTADEVWVGTLPEPLGGNPTGAGDACVAALARGLREQAGLRAPTAWPALLADALALSAAAVADPIAGSFDDAVYHRVRPHVSVSAPTEGRVPCS